MSLMVVPRLDRGDREPAEFGECVSRSVDETAGQALAVAVSGQCRDRDSAAAAATASEKDSDIGSGSDDGPTIALFPMDEHLEFDVSKPNDEQGSVSVSSDVLKTGMVDGVVGVVVADKLLLLHDGRGDCENNSDTMS